MEATRSSETLATIYKTTWRHNPENNNRYVFGRIQKSQMSQTDSVFKDNLTEMISELKNTEF
jgi:hypothetical protein